MVKMKVKTGGQSGSSLFTIIQNIKKYIYICMRKGKGGQLLFKGAGHLLKDGLGVSFVPERIQAYIMEFPQVVA